MTAESQVEFDPFAGPAIAATAPTTESQREIWTALALGDDASLAFNESVTLRFSGSLDVPLLKQTWAELGARHEAFRATLSGDGLTVCIAETANLDVREFDWSTLSEAEQQQELSRHLTREVETPFDLTTACPFRLTLVRLAESSHLATITAHHIVCDGWSTAVIVKDWAALYNARRRGSTPNLPPSPQLSDYARAELAVPAAERQADEAYWLRQFSGEIPVLDLPSDRPRPPRKTYAARRFDGLLDRELLSELRRTSAQHRASLFATLLTGFYVLLHRLSAQEDLVVGIPAAGQAKMGLNVVGHCVNMLPIRSSVRADERFSELLARVKGNLLDAQEHQHFTFGTLLTKLPISRDPSRLPLVSVIFNVDRGMTSEAIGFEDVHVTLSANPRHYENFDLFLNAVEIDGRVELECQYNTDLYDRETIERWLLAYRTLLADAAQNPSREVGRLAVLSSQERQLLAVWNATFSDYRRDARVFDLVRERAAADPDRVACEFGDSRLSYGELERRSNQLARQLRQRGARRGALVGLCVERSLDLLVGLLAITKAGAAYVPLDPDYPAERLAFMVEDSQMPVLVTQAGLRQELSLAAPVVLCIDDPALFSDDADASPLPDDNDAATPESPAYVIYTSGSTGKPKGVLVPHRSAPKPQNPIIL